MNDAKYIDRLTWHLGTKEGALARINPRWGTDEPGGWCKYEWADPEELARLKDADKQEKP
jgi:hypothetical protein